MSSAPILSLLLALALAILAVGTAEGLLAYVARREPEEPNASLPLRGALALGAAVFVATLALVWGRPLTTVAMVRAGWAAALAVIFTVDLRVRYILDIFTAPLAVLALAAAVLLGQGAGATLGGQPTFLEAVGGALVGLVIYGAFFALGLALFRRPAIGLGDVKLALLLGLMVGVERIVTAIFLAALIGGLASILLVASRRVKLGDAPAYGTYMTIGGYLVLLGAAGVYH
jgi:leader peptidase (prepilin peptidase)/N-methyltransferase